MYENSLHEIDYKGGREILEIFLMKAFRLLNGITQGIISWKDVYQRLSLLHLCKKDSRTFLNWLNCNNFIEKRGSHGIKLTKKTYMLIGKCKIEGQDSPPCNITASCNRYIYSKRKKMEKILRIVEASEGIYPKEAANRTGISHSTCRSYLIELWNNGQVNKYSIGMYYPVQKSRHGLEAVKVHNIRFMHKIHENIEYKHQIVKQSIFADKVKLSVEFGKRNRKATCTMHGGFTFSLREVVLLGDVFRQIIHSILGYIPSFKEIEAVSIEFNCDFFGLSVQGAKCITLHSLGCIERLYNKEDRLRYEVRPGPFCLKELIGLMDSGIAYANQLQRMQALEEKMEALTNSVSKTGKMLSSFINHFWGSDCHKKLNKKAPKSNSPPNKDRGYK